MNGQIMFQGGGCHKEIGGILERHKVKKPFLVCDQALPLLGVREYLDNLSLPILYFDEFDPNPSYDSMVLGLQRYQREGCDCVVAIGGGSAIDVAKCIKLYAKMDAAHNLLQQDVIRNEVPLLALPTTAGTGSEATRFVVLYYNGEKQSIAHDDILPRYAILDADFLNTLPPYQRQSTMMDALCHAVESYWSIHSNEVSLEYSRQALGMIWGSREGYLDNVCDDNERMLFGANMAGKAINVTQTTGAHAMSYKLTSLLGIAHGHAVAVCLPKLWARMVRNADAVMDSRGTAHVMRIFHEIAARMGCTSPMAAIEQWEHMLVALGLYPLPAHDTLDMDVLVDSVNATRLRNNPVNLSQEAIRELYAEILCESKV